MIATDETSMFKPQFCLYHLRLIIFATEIAKTMLLHTTVYLICDWDSFVFTVYATVGACTIGPISLPIILEIHFSWK